MGSLVINESTHLCGCPVSQGCSCHGRGGGTTRLRSLAPTVNGWEDYGDADLPPPAGASSRRGRDARSDDEIIANFDDGLPPTFEEMTRRTKAKMDRRDREKEERIAEATPSVSPTPVRNVVKRSQQAAGSEPWMAYTDDDLPPPLL